MNRRALVRLIFPTLLLALLLWPTLRWDELASGLSALGDETHTLLRHVLTFSAWMTGAWWVVRVLEVGFWQLVVARRLGGPVPRLLPDVGAGMIFLMALAGFVGVTLGLPLTGLWATSGVVGLVVGFALQSMIADVFSGIAINVDRPFSIGHWVRLQPRGVEAIIGCVEEVSWRSTRLRSADNLLHVVPNSLLGTMTITNLSLPETHSRFELSFCVDLTVSSQRVLRVLEAAVRAAPILDEPEASVRIEDVDERGVEYVVRYWIDTTEMSPQKGRHLVCQSVLAHFEAAGIRVSHPQSEVFLAERHAHEVDLEREPETLVRRIGLFASLDDDEVAELSGRMTPRRFAIGDSVFEQGDDGDSMFFVLEGLLSVFTAAPGRDEPVRIGQIAAGEYFGEMSLLTGEPRSASISVVVDAVAYEITRDDLGGLISSRPQLARELARVVADRQARNREEFERIDRAAQEAEVSGLAEQLFKRMSSLFRGLGGTR